MEDATVDLQAPSAAAAFAFPVAIILAATGVVIDWATRIELNVAILYSLPLVIAAVARDRKLVWALAAVLLVVTFGVYFAQVDDGEASMRGFFFMDRVLAAACILLNAGILDAWMRSVDRLLLRDLAIRKQNEVLAATNRELTLHKQQVTSQNEELERRRLEIEQVSMRKTQMLASLSHDIRTPIQAITLLSELMRRTAERPELAGRIPALAQRLRSNALSVVDFLSASGVERRKVDRIAGLLRHRGTRRGSMSSLPGKPRRLLPVAWSTHHRYSSTPRTTAASSSTQPTHAT
jgi:signal transduction histidine kinase